MSNFTKKKFVHILHRQSFFKGKLKMQGNYCISAGDSKLSVEMLVIDEIVPTLLHALEDDETSDTALDGLKQILRELIFHMVMKIALKNHSAWSFR
ncbi:uncharacterized protein LOC108319721 isoform X14 [Vigna angularis]|uniref:uncharacterized protein LOC108319721 isoform X14 n=1 Tax=Phaseolus angularis TaxID=3914 RepID=UPI00080A0A3C|nr:uncharacterized protein LOC108319721 isoform X14 [Vigna angularis]XP_052727352.1 uncharacterized protein LOC108319721 isoform X14 [Vigna angularis]